MAARILIVSNDAWLRENLLQKLEPEGYELTWVASVPEASERVAREAYDLAVLDGAMPGRREDWDKYDHEFMKAVGGADNPLRPRVLVLSLPWQNEGMNDWRTGPDGYGLRPEPVRTPQRLPDRSLQHLIKRMLPLSFPYRLGVVSPALKRRFGEASWVTPPPSGYTEPGG